MPIDTMMPVMPARVRARPDVFDRTEMHVHSRRRPGRQPDDDHDGRGAGSRGPCRAARAARPTKPAIRPACSESLPSVADTVWTACGFELDRQRAVACRTLARSLASLSVKVAAAVIWTLASVKTAVWTAPAPTITVPSSTIAMLPRRAGRPCLAVALRRARRSTPSRPSAPSLSLTVDHPLAVLHAAPSAVDDGVLAERRRPGRAGRCVWPSRPGRTTVGVRRSSWSPRRDLRRPTSRRRRRSCVGPAGRGRRGGASSRGAVGRGPTVVGRRRPVGRAPASTASDVRRAAGPVVVGCWPSAAAHGRRPTVGCGHGTGRKSDLAGLADELRGPGPGPSRRAG